MGIKTISFQESLNYCRMWKVQLPDYFGSNATNDYTLLCLFTRNRSDTYYLKVNVASLVSEGLKRLKICQHLYNNSLQDFSPVSQNDFLKTSIAGGVGGGVESLCSK